MEKIIRPGKNCLYGALENIFRFGGMDISEEEIFLLQGYAVSTT